MLITLAAVLLSQAAMPPGPASSVDFAAYAQTVRARSQDSQPDAVGSAHEAPPTWAFDAPDTWIDAVCGATEACRREARNRLAMARAERMEAASAEQSAARAARRPSVTSDRGWRCEQVRVEDRDTGYSSTENVCGTGDYIAEGSVRRQLREAPVSCQRRPVQTGSGVVFADECRPDERLNR